jgi:hypothetical protein
MRSVYTADNPMQAYVVKNFLEAEGIPAVVVGEGLFILRLGIGMSQDTLPQVCCVRDEDAERARVLLERREDAERAATPSPKELLEPGIAGEDRRRKPRVHWLVVAIVLLFLAGPGLLSYVLPWLLAFFRR